MLSRPFTVRALLLLSPEVFQALCYAKCLIFHYFIFTTLLGIRLGCSHFADEKNEVKRGSVMYARFPQSQNWDLKPLLFRNFSTATKSWSGKRLFHGVQSTSNARAWSTVIRKYCADISQTPWVLKINSTPYEIALPNHRGGICAKLIVHGLMSKDAPRDRA